MGDLIRVPTGSPAAVILRKRLEVCGLGVVAVQFIEEVEDDALAVVAVRPPEEDDGMFAGRSPHGVTERTVQEIADFLLRLSPCEELPEFGLGDVRIHAEVIAMADLRHHVTRIMQ